MVGNHVMQVVREPGAFCLHCAGSHDRRLSSGEQPIQHPCPHCDTCGGSKHENRSPYPKMNRKPAPVRKGS